MFAHQKVAVEWMRTREAVVQLGVRGGMILDAPGLGKTRIALELFATESLVNLVIAPARVMAVWAEEANKHFERGVFNVQYVESSGKKLRLITAGTIPLIVASYNQVLLAYNRAEKQFNPDTVFGKVSLWQRILLDESHYIRNPNSKTTEAILALDSDRTWIMTATPMFNGLDDLRPQLQFLGAVISKTPELWRKYRLNINEIMESLVIRRSYIDAGINMVDVHEERRVLEFSSGEREFYNALYSYTQSRCREFVARTMPSNNYFLALLRGRTRTLMLDSILRLRQACCSPELVISKLEFTKQSSTLKDITRNLHERIRIDAGRECCICMDADANIATEPCAHTMCKQCWLAIAEKCQGLCPICRTETTGYTDVVKLMAQGEQQQQLPSLPKSTKITALIAELVAHPNEKIIVFSQWTRLLQIVAENMPPSVSFTIMSGATSPVCRVKQIAEFQKDDELRVALCSTGAMSEGVTLTAASRVYFLDDWWCVEKSRQAKHRVIRVGQTRPVTVVYFHIRDTIEDYVLKIQQNKLAEINKSRITLVQHIIDAMGISVC